MIRFNKLMLQKINKAFISFKNNFLKDVDKKIKK